MSYQKGVSFNLGSHLAGLTLVIQLHTTAGDNYGSLIEGVLDLGEGTYYILLTLEDDWRGGAAVHEDGVPGTTLLYFAINPEESQGVNVLSLAGSTTSLNKLAASASTIVIGTAITGTLSRTQMTTNLTEAINDHFNGRIVIWTSGVLIGQASNITDYDGPSKTLTFAITTEAPANLDTFVII